MFRRGSRKSLRRKQQKQKRQPIVLKSPREIQIMREAGRIVAKVHGALREAIEPGVSTWDLDQLAHEMLQKYGATSSFLGYGGSAKQPPYPGHVCTSVNDQLVHGIPSKRDVLHEGDIISIDVGAHYRGFIGDSAWSYTVGEISGEAQELMRVTEESLYKGIEQAVTGRRVVDIGRAVQKHVEKHGFYIVREYTGHGVGREMHEGPQVLNYESEDPDGEVILQPGLVIAIEPMVQFSTHETKTLKDKWTVVSKDGGLAAHFEHTVAITNRGPEILTKL